MPTIDRTGHHVCDSNEQMMKNLLKIPKKEEIDKQDNKHDVKHHMKVKMEQEAADAKRRLMNMLEKDVSPGKESSFSAGGEKQDRNNREKENKNGCNHHGHDRGAGDDNGHDHHFG